MNNSPYTIRNYQPPDFHEYVRLISEAEKLEPSGRCISEPVIADHLGRPNYSPEQDLFLAEMAGKIVGYMAVAPELSVGRVILDCWVHPDHRRQGLGTKLLGYAFRHAGELGIKVAHLNVMEDNVAARAILSKLGFEFVRKFLELRLDLAKLRQQDIDRAAKGCRYLRRGEEDKLAQIQNRSFAGTWGFNPNTVEEIIYSTNATNCSTDDVVITCEGANVVGYCWTGITCHGEISTGERRGRVFMIGVHPDYRGKGIGKRVLLAGLAHLKSKGLTATDLTVDSENKTAVALYLTIGFEVRANSLWYEKSVN